MFIGIGQQINRGAMGLMEAVKKGMCENIGEELYGFIMSRVSSICTDGTNVNTGDKNSLWQLFEDECLKFRSELPLLKLWCSAHCLELVWGDLTNRVKEARLCIEMLSSIASFFHESALLTTELREIAAENDLKILSIPKVFKVRWSEWTYTTVVNILKS